MRWLIVLTALTTGCGLTSYEEDRDSLLREVRETEIGPYDTDVDERVTVRPASKELEESIKRDGMTLAHAIRYAMARNPELVSALSHWEMLLARVPQVSSFEDPMIFYEEYIEPTETRSGPKE